MLEISQEIDSPISPRLGQNENDDFVDDKIDYSKTTSEDVIEFLNFCFVEDSRIPEPFFELKSLLKHFAGDNILAVLPYGSMINMDDGKDSWLDAFVITENRKEFHKSCKPIYKENFFGIGRLSGYHSFLEGICAPNYYHIMIKRKDIKGKNKDKDFHFKYCPIEIKELENAVVERDFSLTGRFMKGMRIMEDVDESIKYRLMDIYYESMLEGVEMAVDIVTEDKKEFNLKQMIYALLGASYFTDRRLDKNLTEKIDDIYHNEDKSGGGNSYNLVFREFLNMDYFNFVEEIERNHYVDIRDEDAKKRSVEEIIEDLEKNWKKAVLRMYKGALTNQGAKDYALKKAAKAGGLRWWMNPVKLLPNFAIGMLIPLGAAYQGLAEIEKLMGFGPLKKREKELDAFLGAVKNDNLPENEEQDEKTIRYINN